MSQKSNKVGYLLIGLMLGFCVGIALLWWQFDKIDSILFSHNKNEKESSIDAPSGNPELLSAEAENNKNIERKISADPRMSDTTIHSVEEFLKLFKGEFPDSVLIATYNRRFENTANGEDVVVMKDQMLFARTIKIDGFEKKSGSSENLDSLLVDDPSAKKETDVTRVEFWKSPINYKGYKMDENKIVLFGILEYNEASLKSIDGEIFLKYKNEFFHLENTDSFKSFVSLKDASFIRRLNSL
ncbi:MAG: hypothetical protein WCM76_15660 [Bacteroidota bacterium]